MSGSTYIYIYTYIYTYVYIYIQLDGVLQHLFSNVYREDLLDSDVYLQRCYGAACCVISRVILSVFTNCSPIIFATKKEPGTTAKRAPLLMYLSYLGGFHKKKLKKMAHSLGARFSASDWFLLIIMVHLTPS